MAKLKLTPNQRQFRKEVGYIKTEIKRLQRQGYYFKDVPSLIPKMPTRVTKKTIRQLGAYREQLYKKATYAQDPRGVIDPTTGAIEPAPQVTPSEYKKSIEAERKAKRKAYSKARYAKIKRTKQAKGVKEFSKAKIGEMAVNNWLNQIWNTGRYGGQEGFSALQSLVEEICDLYGYDKFYDGLRKLRSDLYFPDVQRCYKICKEPSEAIAYFQECIASFDFLMDAEKNYWIKKSDDYDTDDDNYVV